MIVMNDFKKEYLFHKDSILKAVTETLESGWYILGKQVEEFEKDFASYIGTQYAIGVANGLEALQISLMALGVGKDDEVLTVSNSAVATTLAITNVGAKPVFIDIDEYFHMDVNSIEKYITPRTKVILPVHLFGQIADMHTINEIAKKHNLTVVEDACQAAGAEFFQKKAGALGTLGCFSFYPTKNLGGYGDGGAITTNSQELYEVCKMLRNYGQKDRYHHKIKGINSRLDEIQAAILRVKLPYLSEGNIRRNQIAELYKKELLNIDGLTLPKLRENALHTFHLFVIEVEKRDALQTYLKEHNVQSLIHYPVPIHKQDCYPEFNQLALPITEYKAEHILSLPCHQFLLDEEVLTVTQRIKEFYR